MPSPARLGPTSSRAGFRFDSGGQRNDHERHLESKGCSMLILAIHETPSLTQERYEEVVRRLTGKNRIDSPSDLPFDGLLVHAAGQGPNGFCVFDVFESEEAVKRFRSAMGTIPQDVGIEEPPQFFPAHTAMSVAI
jgi:hypothetical protein